MLLSAALPVAAQQRATVLNLRAHEAAGELQARRLVEARPILGRPQLNVLVPVARGVAEEPAAVAVPGDGDSAPHQLVQARRRQVDVAHDDDLRGLFEPGSRQLLIIHRHDEGLARLGHLRTAGLNVQRQCVGAGHGDRTRGDVGSLEMVDLVRQTDLDQGAARTLWAVVFERRRDDALRGDAPQALDLLLRGGDELVVERDAHPFAARDEVEHTLVAVVAVLAQEESLHAELHPLGIVGPALEVRALAALVVDRRHLAAVRLDQIHPGDQTQAVRGQRESTARAASPPSPRPRAAAASRRHG